MLHPDNPINTIANKLTILFIVPLSIQKTVSITRSWMETRMYNSATSNLKECRECCPRPHGEILPNHPFGDGCLSIGSSLASSPTYSSASLPLFLLYGMSICNYFQGVNIFFHNFTFSSLWSMVIKLSCASG